MYIPCKGLIYLKRYGVWECPNLRWQNGHYQSVEVKEDIGITFSLSKHPMYPITFSLNKELQDGITFSLKTESEEE